MQTKTTMTFNLTPIRLKKKSRKQLAQILVRMWGKAKLFYCWFFSHWWVSMEIRVMHLHKAASTLTLWPVTLPTVWHKAMTQHPPPRILMQSCSLLLDSQKLRNGTNLTATQLMNENYAAYTQWNIDRL